MSKKDIENREHPRYEVTAYVDYTGTEVLLYHSIENVSLGGICIHSTNIEKCGTIVDLVINFPDLDTIVAVQGEVVWANFEEPKDMGIKFIGLDEERIEILKKYIVAVRQKKPVPK